MKLHCEAKGLRSLDEYRYQIGRMENEWTGRDFKSLGRGDLSKLLDKVETKSGQRQANLTLAVFSSMANWFAAREDDYRSPVVRGMKRGDAVGRDRILDDDELRSVWKQAEANGTFGAFVRLSLLTGQRKEKVAAMRWEDLNGTTWTIPTEAERRATLARLCFPRLRLRLSTRSHALHHRHTCSRAKVAVI